jgi:hypothetical protein
MAVTPTPTARSTLIPNRAMPRRPSSVPISLSRATTASASTRATLSQDGSVPPRVAWGVRRFEEG